MDFLTAYAIYATGAILLVGAFAARVPHENVRIVFLLGILWPLSVVAILFMLVVTATGWDMDLAKGAKAFGFRKPGNPQIKGFAVTVLFQEFQFFKMR
jgi:hypothetical protein